MSGDKLSEKDIKNTAWKEYDQHSIKWILHVISVNAKYMHALGDVLGQVRIVIKKSNHYSAHNGWLISSHWKIDTVSN